MTTRNRRCKKYDVTKKRNRPEGAQRRRRRLGLDHVHKYRYPVAYVGLKPG